MGRQDRAARVKQRLVDDEGFACEGIGRDGQLHCLRPVGGLGDEGLLGCHGRAGRVGQNGAGARVGELGAQGVLTALHYVREANGVLDGCVSAGQVLVAVCGVDGHGVDFCLGVVQGPQVKRAVVARDGYLRGDEDIALVGVAAQLLKAVGVVRQGAQVIVCCGAHAKPGPGCGIKTRRVNRALLVQCPVVAVGVYGVRVPIGRAGEETVLVGDDDVRLAGG